MENKAQHGETRREAQVGGGPRGPPRGHECHKDHREGKTVPANELTRVLGGGHVWCQPVGWKEEPDTNPGHKLGCGAVLPGKEIYTGERERR